MGLNTIRGLEICACVFLFIPVYYGTFQSADHPSYNLYRKCNKLIEYKAADLTKERIN